MAIARPTYLTTATESNYPDGFWSIALVFLFGSVGFAVLFSLLVLYATRLLGFTDHAADALFAAYAALIYGMPVIGGYLGGRFFGHRLAVTTALILSTIGLSILALPYSHHLLFVGLGFFVIGTATYVPNLWVLLGRLYHKQDSRRESGFTICYITMNIGMLLGEVPSGYILRAWGFHTTFLLGAIAMMIALVLFVLAPKQKRQHVTNIGTLWEPHGILPRAIGLVLVLITIPLTIWLLGYAYLTNALLFVTGIGVCFLIIGLALRERRGARNKLFTFLILFIIGLAWASLYMLTPTALMLFTERNLDRHIFDLVIPTSSIIGLNPFFIITYGSLLSMLWVYLARHNRTLSIPAKFAIGVISMGLGYLILVPGIMHANPLGYTAFGWVVLSYFLQTNGELLVNPIGFSMVGRLVPARYEGLMIGIWQLVTGVGSAISGYLAESMASPPHIRNPLLTNSTYLHGFARYGLVTIGVGLIAALMIPWIKRIMGQRKTS